MPEKIKKKPINYQELVRPFLWALVGGKGAGGRIRRTLLVFVCLVAKSVFSPFVKFVIGAHRRARRIYLIYSLTSAFLMAERKNSNTSSFTT